MGKKDVNKYAYLDQLSTQELQELLRADIDSPESGDDEAIFYILEVMERRERKNPSDDSSDLDRCWNEFQTLYNTPEGMGRSLYPTDEAASSHANPRPALRRHRPLRRVMLAAAAVAMITVFLTVPVGGYASIFEMLGTWTSQQFTMISSDSGPGGPTEDFEGAQVFEETAGDELRQVLAEHGITEKVVPTWMPEGFKIRGDVFVKEFPALNEIQFFVLYSNDSDSLSITVIDHIGNPQNKIYEKTADSPTVYHAGGIQHHLFESSDNLGSLSAAWYNGNIECALNTTLPESELKQIIDSIYEE